jgi:osmotically-inducible protein OsmY
MDERMRPLQNTDAPRVDENMRIAEEVGRTLAATGRFASDRLEVSTSDGTVRLRGRVGSYYQKQVAQAVALRAIGRRQLVNEIEVE